MEVARKMEINKSFQDLFRTATGAGRLEGAYTTHGGPIGAPAASEI